MPFGLVSAPSLFQRLMGKVCHWLPIVTVYPDDVLIHSATAKEHEEHLRQVLERLAAAGLTLCRKKCRFVVS